MAHELATKYVDFTLSGKHSDAQGALSNLLAQRVSSALDERKMQIAQTMCKSKSE